MYRKVYGPKEELLPVSVDGDLLEEKDLLSCSYQEGGTLHFSPGRYLLTQDLYFDRPHLTYDLTGVTLLSRENAEITVAAPHILIKGLISHIPVRGEEDADNVVFSSCRLLGGVTLYPSQSALLHCFLSDRVALYSEKAYVRYNCFEEGELEIFDSCCTLFADNLLIRTPVTISYGHNDTIFCNKFDQSSLFGNHCVYLTLAQNESNGNCTLEACKNTLITDNRLSPVINGGDHVYGNDIPINLPEFGCDQASLPPKGFTRFMMIQPQDRVRTFDDAGVEHFVSVSDYLTAQLQSDASLLLPPGLYFLPKGEMAHLLLQSKKTISLYAYGVCFLCQDYTQSALILKNCTDVSVFGLSIDFREIPNTQGMVAQVVDEKTILWMPDDGYPDTLCDPTRYGATGAAEGYRKGSDRPFEDIYIAHREKKGKTTLLQFVSPHRLQEKDKVVIRGNFAHVVYMTGCTRCLFEDVTLYAGSGFGFMEFTGEGGTVLRRVLLTPGMPPVSGAPERLISVCDATHSTCMRKGISVYDSLFEKMTDDATNVNGCYGDVLEQKRIGANTLITYGTGTSNYTSLCDDFRVGDLVLIYTREGKLLYRGSALEATSTQGNNKTVLCQGLLTLEPNAAIQNASANGYGFLFENSSFSNNRSRGLLIKAWGGRINHCTLSHHGMSALLIKAEIEDGWGECGFTQDFIAENNLIFQSGFFTGNELHSPIHITGDCPPTADTAYHNQKRIVLRHNRVEARYNRYAVMVSNAEDIVIEDNSFGPRLESYKEFNPHIINPNFPKDIQAPICIRESNNVAIRNNLLPEGCSEPVDFL